MSTEDAPTATGADDGGWAWQRHVEQASQTIERLAAAGIDDPKASLLSLTLDEVRDLRRGLVPEASVADLQRRADRVAILVRVLAVSLTAAPPRARKGGLTARGECMAEERHRFTVQLDGEGLQAPDVQRQVTGALTMAVNAKGCPSCAALGRRRRRTRVVWTLVEVSDG